MSEREMHKTDGTKGEDRAREGAAAKMTRLASAGMSSGWSVMWDSAALGELQTHKHHPGDGEKNEEATGAK